MKRDRSSYIVSILLLLICLTAAIRIGIHGFIVTLDPFALIPGIPRLQQENTVRFLVEGEKRDEAKSALHTTLSPFITWREFSFAQLQKLCAQLFPYRAALSPAESISVLSCPNPESCLRDHLLSMMSAQAFTGELFTCDPLLLSPKWLERIAASNSSELLIGSLQESDTVAGIESGLRELRSQFPKTTFTWSGFPRFAAASKARFDHEFAFMSTVSLLSIVLILRLVFSNFLPLGVSVLSSFLGFLTGVLTCIAFRGEIHGITLSLGSSLLGACVDYAIHWFAERYWRAKDETREVWKDVSPALRLGMYTSTLAILPFVFSGSVLLVEFFLFCSGALVGSYLGLLVLPVPKPARISKKPYEFSAWICRSLRRIRAPVVRIPVLSMIVLIAGAGLLRLTANDDIRLLQPPDPQLISDEVKVLKGEVPNAHLVFKGKTEQETLSSFIQVLKKFESLENTPNSPRLPFKLSLPKSALQLQNIQSYEAFLRNNQKSVNSVFDELGVQVSASQMSTDDLKELDLNFLKIFIPELFTAKNEIILPVSHWKNSFALPSGVQVLDYRQAISGLFKTYRFQSMICLGFGYLMIGVFFLAYYRSIASLKLLVPCLTAAVITLAFFGLAGIPINFFTTLILALVLGLSVDYAVFFSETEQLEPVALSILASSATTAIAFLPLVWSDTPLLSAIGICMIVGVGSATVAAALIRQRRFS